MRSFISILLISIFLLIGCGRRSKAETQADQAYIKAAVSYCREVQNELVNLSQALRDGDPSKMQSLADSAKQSIDRSKVEYEMVTVPPGQLDNDKQLRELTDEILQALNEISSAGKDADLVGAQMTATRIDALSRKVSMMLAVMSTRQKSNP